MIFLPDWTEIWTARRAEAELKGFTFEGSGWYFADAGLDTPPSGARLMDTLLVIYHGESTEGQLYLFCVYNGRDPSEAFNQIVNLPTRRDDR